MEYNTRGMLNAYRADYPRDFDWFEILVTYGFMPKSFQYCDLFDRCGEVCEDYEHLFRESTILDLDKQVMWDCSSCQKEFDLLVLTPCDDHKYCISCLDKDENSE